MSGEASCTTHSGAPARQGISPEDVERLVEELRAKQKAQGGRTDE